jgi:hypothetical protein
MKANQKQSLERILESAIVVSWVDLMRGAQAGLIHIEYGFSAGGTLDYLRFLSSISRGHWLLVGEYWMQTSESHCAGFRFENGYQSEGLLHLVELMMQHQGAFSLPEDRGRQGLLQISTPTREEIAAATTSVNEALERLDSRFAEPALA